MTELFATKAIVKLPTKRSNKSSSLLLDTATRYTNYLVTDKLYFESMNVTETEIMDLVRSCDPIKIHLTSNNTNAGYIQFLNREKADRAYTLLNGVTIRSTRLQLRINPPGTEMAEPEAHAGILFIKNLPQFMDNNNSLYELFRPFGPMILCKILVEQQGSTFKGTALVQYFFSENAQDAEISMNNKPVQDNIITVIPFVSSKSKPSSSSQPTASSTTTPPLSPPAMNTVRSDGSSMVDYTNLYIKNLDLNVKSADLFNHFRKFGRIISARVMKNAQTKQSKGFGFVSFSKADEAQKAKQDMNGEYILSKPVIVAFHEPKKPRDSILTEASPIPSSYIDHGYYQQQQSRDSRYTNNIPTMDIKITQQQQQQQHQQPSLSALASGAFINTPPPPYAQTPQQQQRPTFRRRGSIESVATVMTESTFKSRRQTITKAVLSTMDKRDEPHLHDIVDMLLTLKKKDLATCLFNNVFLKAKIKHARDALDIFEEQQQQKQRPSRAIPIVAPPPPPPQPETNHKNEEIETFLASLKGLEPHEQKQLLGDRLFPLVKSTGVKGAPRITILLLDSVPLHQLAYTMYDKENLKQKVNQVAQSQQ
ncbi:unnamed protein product [Mucor hiemalis]